MSKEKRENAEKDGKRKPVRISFDMTDEEAARLCALRFEPKPSTAAAQIVRMALVGGEETGEPAPQGGKDAAK